MKQETLASGRYVLDRVIGAGGMADVYRARDTRLGRDVAVKMFRRGSAEGVARGSGEARLLAALHHPGLVRVLDMDAECARLEPAYLVMEYVKGPDLGALLREGPLTPERTTTAGRDIARTLDYIHGRGVIHRDIKPSNVLTRAGEDNNGMFSFLLTDFGIARFFESSRVTATGSLIGTATYFSPEQARGDRVGTPTDIYALGLVLLECLTGGPAFPGTGLESALARLSRPPAIPESVGPGWHSLLTAMTLDDPLSRPSAAEVVRRLEALNDPATHLVPAGALPTTVTDPEPAAPPVPTPTGSGGTTGSGATTGSATPAPGRTSATLDSPHRLDPDDDGTHLPDPAQAEEDTSEAGKRRTRALAVVVVLVALTVVIVLVLLQGAAPGASPLPLVPGSTGAMLDSLYESVQP